MWEMFAERTPYYFLSNPQSIIRYVYYEDGRPNIKDFKTEVDPEIVRLVEVYRLGIGGYTQVVVLADDARARVPPFEAIELELAALRGEASSGG